VTKALRRRSRVEAGGGDLAGRPMRPIAGDSFPVGFLPVGIFLEARSGPMGSRPGRGRWRDADAVACGSMAMAW